MSGSGSIHLLDRYTVCAFWHSDHVGVRIDTASRFSKMALMNNASKTSPEPKLRHVGRRVEIGVATQHSRGAILIFKRPMSGSGLGLRLKYHGHGRTWELHS